MTRRVLLVLMLAASARAQQQKAAHYQVTLRLPSGGLYAGEEMQIEFHVEDTARPDPLLGFAPVIRAAPEAVIDMPAMPGMPKFTETAHAEPVPGDYGIHPTFAHGGTFRMRLTVRPLGADPFAVEFPLEVLDARPKPTPARYTVELTAQPKRPKAGEPVELRLAILDRGAPVTAFDTLHEAPMHLVTIRRDHSQFAHEHPTLARDGNFRLAYTFAAGGEYRLFADVAPRSAGAQILSAKLNVGGSAGAAFDIRRADATRERQAGDTVVVLAESIVPARKTVPLTFTLTPATELEPLFGAPAHLMLLHEDAATFVHCHPDDSGLRFLARFPKPGIYRAWLQFRKHGRIYTTDFLLRAEDAR